jgi:GDP-L-fucose synthase
MEMLDKKIVITGGSGFLGQHVVAAFQNAGYQRLFVPRSRQFDLTARSQVDRLLWEQQPDVVVHLAAVVGGIGANRRNPATFLYQNLIMGVQLIEACRLADVQKFVQVGTICSYPKFTPVPFRETELWNGYPEETNAPYGLAKKMLIAQLQAYRQQYGFNGINVLPVNLYGPGDNFDAESSHVIPALIRKCLEAKAGRRKVLEVWGTGTPTREFIFVKDAALAIRLATERLDTSDPVNIGSGCEISIADVVHRVSRATGFQGEIRFDPAQPDGQPRRCLDTTRAKDLLGFTATTSLDDGLDETVAWYLSKSGSGTSRIAA